MWFKHPESGQVFEAKDQWIALAKSHGCTEVEEPKLEEEKPKQGQTDKPQQPTK